MKHFWNVAIAGLAIAVGMSASAEAELKVGDDAPNFELKGSDGKIYRMSELKGKKAVVIAWYPKAFTGG